MRKQKQKSMSPSELRQRATRNLLSAERLLDSDPDMAAYLAGHAAEMALKARYCSVHKLLALPGDPGARKVHKIDGHELEKLLQQSDQIRIERSALDAIDWAEICKWDNEDRYQAVDTMSRMAAKARLEQTSVLVATLSHFEIVTALIEVERQVAKRYGPFNLFAWWQAAADEPWKILIATPATAGTSGLAGHLEGGTAITREVSRLLPKDLAAHLGSIEACNPEHPIAFRFYNAAVATNGVYTVRGATIFRNLPFPSTRRPGLFQLADIVTTNGGIHRAYVIALQPPPQPGSRVAGTSGGTS